MRIFALVWMIPLLGLALTARAQEPADPVALRQLMVDTVIVETQVLSPQTGIEKLDPKVLAVLGQVPRHLFLPEPLQPYGYNSHPLPLGYDQNLAAPLLVGLMTHLAAIEPGDRVFETGTGAGYHAAVMAELGAEVYSVEVVPELAEQARQTLDKLGYGGVKLQSGDGYYGWPGAAPFDAMIIKESLDHVPSPLLKQLKPGGRLVIPLGPVEGPQALTVILKGQEGELRRRKVLPVIFSPLQGGERT